MLESAHREHREGLHDPIDLLQRSKRSIEKDGEPHLTGICPRFVKSALAARLLSPAQDDFGASEDLRWPFELTQTSNDKYYCGGRARSARSFL